MKTLTIDQDIWDPEDNWRNAWDDSARAKGFISRVTALQIDGDRYDPSRKMGRRSDDPVSRAVSAFSSVASGERAAAPAAVPTRNYSYRGDAAAAPPSAAPAGAADGGGGRTITPVERLLSLRQGRR